MQLQVKVKNMFYRAAMRDGTFSPWYATPFPPTDHYNFAVRQYANADLEKRGVKKEDIIGVQYGDPGCTECDSTPVPHFGSRACKSKSVTAGGFRVHCSCDACF